MARMVAFRFRVEANDELAGSLRRHMGARRFAYNQCLSGVKEALRRKKLDPATDVPWSGFSLVNYFNSWKKTEAAGRRFAVDAAGTCELEDVGLSWRHEVCAQVFEEAAIDLGRALDAHSKSASGERPGPKVGFPTFKKKTAGSDTFRLRSKISKAGTASVRVGTPGQPRSIVLPFIGTVPVREDTRRARRLLRPDASGSPRARICYATVRCHRGRFVISVTLETPDVHPALRHEPKPVGTAPDFTGVDRGLSAYVVAAKANGREVERVTAPRPLHRALPRLQKADRSVTRKQRGSSNRRKANDQRRRLHSAISDQRRDFLHRTSTSLVKTHDGLCIEDLAVSNLVRNRRLARHIADAGWGELARQIRYKAAWYGTDLVIAPRNFASTKTCSGCGWVRADMSLKDRTFACPLCDLVVDRDLNAAVNLAAWANTEHASVLQAPDPEARGRVDNACGGTSSGHPIPGGGTGPERPRRVRGKKQEPANAATSAA